MRQIVSMSVLPQLLPLLRVRLGRVFVPCVLRALARRALRRRFLRLRPPPVRRAARARRAEHRRRLPVPRAAALARGR